MAHPYDGTAAVVVPQSVEKIPLYHWRPGARVLSVGSRDGTLFDGAIPADEARTFHRPLSPELISRAAERCGISTWAATWSESLRYPQGLQMLQDSGLRDGVVASAGQGSFELLTRLLDGAVAAWSLLIDASQPPPPLAKQILQEGRHVEVVLGLSGQPHAALMAALPWSQAAAIHLKPLRASLAVGQDLAAWEDAAMAALPGDSWVYHSRQQVTSCAACGAELVWRHAGKSRLAALKPASDNCAACAARSPIRWL
ncbi:MAG: hypothetical protein EA402_14105 [Planctomycetota bacterium]|nr:MAG: hypothetical protein EA402_14105 [Planctomycetota bacterium]